MQHSGTHRLCADGLQVVDALAKLAARARLLSSRHGRRNDDADALSVGIAAMTAAHLNTVLVDEAVAALRHWSSTARTWSEPAPRRLTGCTRCSPNSSPAGHPVGCLPDLSRLGVDLVSCG
jgi:hypothetical protein